MIDNITNASFFGMVINIKPADSNDLLEEGGQPNQDHGNLLKDIDNKTAKTGI